MHGSGGPELLVLRPTRQEFTTESFQQYCEKVFTAQPDLPCFKCAHDSALRQQAG